MDSHSRSASPREPARPQHRPPSPPSSPKSGFDNRAYQHDESDPNHNDSFTSNGPHPNHQNGHTKEPNGDTKTLEAVNLELINLTPKNGSKKKDVEVDMNSTNPYDEYFVPVNEHRKYMRGEKLYVTADKRGEKGGCKRPLCWTLLALVVVAIVALIVLAATGILFTNSPTPLEQYNASVSSARAFGGITGDRNDDHSSHHHDHSDHDHHEQEQSTTPPKLETQSDEAQLPPISEESSDTSMYVPRTLEGTLKIDNEIFTPDLEDTESEKYRDFTMSFSDALKHALFDRNTLENGDNEIMVEVIQIRNGSLIVTYRIHWIPKHNAEQSEEMTATALKINLNNYLNDNNRMINVYHVADEEIPTTQVLDLCKINNFECEYKCEFDDSTLDFMCVCPPGQIVDMRTPKRCMTLLENSDQGNPETTAKKETNALNYNSNESSMPSSSEEKASTEKVSLANEESIFDWKEPRHYTPETTTETEPDLNFSHIFGPDTPKPEPEPNAEPEVIPMAEPTLTPKPEDDADSNIEPKPEPTAEPQAEPTPEPSAEPNPEPEPAPEPNSEPSLVPEPTALPEPESKPEPTAEQNPDSEPTSGPTAEPKPEPEPTAEPNPEPEPTTSPNTDPQSIAEPEPGSSTETQQEQESIAEPQPELKTVTEQELSQRPQPGDASTSSPETTVSSVTMISNKEILISREDTKQDGSTEPNATSKQTIMFDHPTFDLDSIIGLHTTAEPETSDNTESNLAIRPLENSENANENMEKNSPTTMRISLSEPHIINEPSYEPKPKIISILMENGRRMNFTSIDATNYTTPENDWLEAEDENNNMSSETTTRNVNDQMDSEMQNEGSSEHVNRTEQRSSKKFGDLAFESTTDSMNENNSDDITFDLIKKNNEMQSVLTTMEPNIEKTEDTSDVATLNKNNFEITTFTTTYPSKMDTQQENVEVKEILVESNTELITQNKADTKLNHTTPTPEYSINKQFEGSEADQNLIEVLNINKTSNKMLNVTATEKDLPDESKDVTFDNISMLYNRSSKSIEKEENTNLEVTESTEESGENTTDSDWLSESVAEVNYEDVMNKIEKQDTTETSPSKIDEIMGRGITKDDFEPDYLNNMGSKTTKMSDQDVALYGMSQDYDNEDSRFKRVNMDKDKSDVNTKNNRTEAKQEMAINSAIETTTIGQYIYKVSQQNMNESLANSESSSTTPKPAPVWEESESEGMDDLTVKELPKQNVHDKVDGISITSTALPLTTTSTDLKQFYQDNSTSMSELIPQNTTAVNNLNVTIYEISSHSGNQSFLSLKPTNSPSTEFVDHETEMNPFLPEVENNKSLVKKLQEGHDLEPTSLNETQNENVEEHIPSNPDIISSVVSKQATENNETHSSNATLLVTPETEPETTTEQIEDEDFLFNQLFTNSHEQESEFTTEVNKMFPSPTISNKDRTITTKTNENKEVLPISTFLLDTDDLDTTKKPSTLTESDLNLSLSNEQMTSDPIKDTNSEFLSVVPIEQENFMQPLQKNYNSESSQELNYISDSPKKSDRRTIDVNNLDSVINNVA